MNRVTLIGRINGEPEFKTSQKTNKLFAAVRVITRKEAFVTPTGEQYPAREQIHRVSVFGRTAEKMAQRQKLNPLAESIVCVDGEITYNSIEDNFGNIQTRTDIFANNVELL